MTALIDRVQAVLQPLAAGGAWLGVNAAQPPVYPYLVHQYVAADPNANLDGANPLQYARVQVDVYAKRGSEAVAIGRAAQAAMQADPLAAAALAGLGGPLYDAETRTFRYSADFGIWSTD